MLLYCSSMSTVNRSAGYGLDMTVKRQLGSARPWTCAWIAEDFDDAIHRGWFKVRKFESSKHPL